MLEQRRRRGDVESARHGTDDGTSKGAKGAKHVSHGREHKQETKPAHKEPSTGSKWGLRRTSIVQVLQPGVHESIILYDKNAFEGLRGI